MTILNKISSHNYSLFVILYSLYHMWFNPLLIGIGFYKLV
jgi:hypothetical protein